MNLTNGSKRTMTLNADPINNTLTDPDTGDTLYDKDAPAIIRVYEGDAGEKAASIDFAIISTTTTDIAESVSGDSDSE